MGLALAMRPTQVAFLLPTLQKVREAARRHSAQIADVALTGCACIARLAPTMAALCQDYALHAAAHDGEAVNEYAICFSLAANTLVLRMDRFEQNLHSVFDTAELQAPATSAATTSPVQRSGASRKPG